MNNHDSRRPNELCIYIRLLSYVYCFTNIIISIIVAFLLTDPKCITRHCGAISVFVPEEMTSRQISPSTGCEIAV